MQENNDQQDELEDHVFQLNSEVSSLKLQLKAKDNIWNKERAILHQRIELQELQIKECKVREDNLKKMNETFMSTLSSISNETNKPANKPLKDLNCMIEGINFDNENNKAKRSDYIAKLEQENRSLKDLLHEKQIEFEQLSITNVAKSNEQKETIINLKQEISLIMSSKQQFNDVDRVRQTVEEEYRGQIDHLKKEIDRIKNECAEQILSQKEQIQKNHDTQSEIAYQLQIKNIIEEMQRMHAAEISSIQAQWDILQRNQFQDQLAAKTQKEDLESQLQKATEKLNLSIKKGKISEENSKAQKDKYENQIEELEKQISLLKKSNGILSAEIHNKKVVSSIQDTEMTNQHQQFESKQDFKGERQIVTRISQIQISQKARGEQRTPTTSQEPKQRTGKSKERQTEQFGISQNVNFSNQDVMPRISVGNTKSEVSTNITPRQHFKSMTESDRPLSMRSSSGRHFDFPNQQVPEEKPKRAAARIQKNRSSPKQLIPLQGSVVSSSNPFAGMIVQKVSTKTEESKSNLAILKQNLNGGSQANQASSQHALKTQSLMTENQSIFKAYQQLNGGSQPKVNSTEGESHASQVGNIIGSPKSSVSKEREYTQESNYNSAPYFYPQQNKIESSSSHQFKNLLISRDIHKKISPNLQVAQSFSMQNQQINESQNQIGVSPINFKSNSVEKRIFFKQQLDRGADQNHIMTDKPLLHNHSAQIISKSDRLINEKHRQLLQRPNTSKSPNPKNEQIQSRKESTYLRNTNSSQNFSSIIVSSQKDFEQLLNHQLTKHV